MTWPTTRFATAGEIYDRLREFAARPAYAGLCTATDLANTHAGTRSNYIRIGRRPTSTSTSPSVTVVLTGGVHAREWAPPHALVNMIEKLLDAASATPVAGITIGDSFALTPAEVSDIIAKVDLYVAPMINPDGYNRSRSRDSTLPPDTRNDRGWRKNTRPITLPATPAGCTTRTGTGVDINRNFPVLWDFTTCYTGGGVAVGTSTCPASITFAGPSARSEVETNNVITLLNNNPRFFVDVHMFGPTILHSWGIEENEPVSGPTPTPPCTTTPQRDGILASGHASYTGYREPINRDHLGDSIRAAEAMHAGVGAATGAVYPVQPSAQLYVASGCADDYAFYRSLSQSTPCFAFTMECGTTFLPLFTTEFPAIEKEIQAGLLALLKHAASTVASSPATTGGGTTGGGTTGGGTTGGGTTDGDAPPSGGTGGTGTSEPSGSGGIGDLCSFRTIYEPAHPHLQLLRRVRDRELPRSRFGRRLGDAILRGYWRVSPGIARFLQARPWARRAARWTIAEPGVAIVRASSRLARIGRSPAAQANTLALLLVAALIAAVGGGLAATAAGFAAVFG